MTDKDTNTPSLEALFETARATPPEMPEGLLAKVVADAERQMPAAAKRRPMSRLRRWFETLGGGAGVGGLITATCVGFWIGVAPPDGLLAFGDALAGTAADDTIEIATTQVYDNGWISGLEEVFEND